MSDIALAAHVEVARLTVNFDGIQAQFWLGLFMPTSGAIRDCNCRDRTCLAVPIRHRIRCDIEHGRVGFGAKKLNAHLGGPFKGVVVDREWCRSRPGAAEV